MNRSVSERVAHVFTPWDWQSRTSVFILLWVDVVLFIGMLAAGLLRASSGIAGAGVGAVVSGLIGYLLFLRPGLRSTKRWDAAHTAKPTSTIA